MTLTKLYEGTAFANPIELSQSINNFKELIFFADKPQDNAHFMHSNVYPVESLSSGDRIGVFNDSSYCWYTITDDTTLTFAMQSSGYNQIITVYGVN